MVIRFDVPDPMGLGQAVNTIGSTLSSVLANQGLQFQERNRQAQTGTILQDALSSYAQMENPTEMDLLKSINQAISKGADPKTAYGLYENVQNNRFKNEQLQNQRVIEGLKQAGLIEREQQKLTNRFAQDQEKTRLKDSEADAAWQILRPQLINAGINAPEERPANLTTNSINALATSNKPIYEPTTEKLSAEDDNAYRKQILNRYESAQTLDTQLARMERLNESNQLSTPASIKALQTFGVPLSFLNNPSNEEFEKLSLDLTKNITQVYGNRILKTEFDNFLRTIPTLLNTKEGRERIINNLRLMNEGAKIKYDAYKQLRKEGETRNLQEKIIEITGPRLDELSMQFQSGLDTVHMRGPDGQFYDIPIELKIKAIKEGGFIEP